MREKPNQDDLYREVTSTYSAALDRLGYAYESDADKRRDLLQEIHFALWRSLETFEARCSLRTWVYRIAHNTAISHVIRQRKMKSGGLVSLEDIEAMPDRSDHERIANERMAVDRLLQLIHKLKPLDRQLMLLYLEEMDTASIAEITGISAAYVRTQIHRIKAILARRFDGEGLV